MPDDIKISDLPPATLPLDGDELVAVVQNGVTVSVRADDILAVAADGVLTVQVYVSQANGSDANDGLTILTPLATAQAYIDRFPSGPAWGVSFHFDSGNHVQFAFPRGWGRLSPIWMFGDGAGQVGDDGLLEVRAGEASLAGTTERVIITSGTVTTALVGSTVEITSGVAIGAMRHINNVIGDDVYVGRSITGLLPGDTFRIVDPAAVVLFTSTAVIASHISQTRLRGPVGSAVDFRTVFGIVNMRWDFTSGTAFRASMPECHVLAFGWVVSGDQIGTLLGGTSVSAAQEFSSVVVDPWADALSYIAAANPAYPVDDTAIQLRWVGWGLVPRPVSANLKFIVLTQIAGYLTMDVHGTRATLKQGESLLQGGSGGVFCGQSGLVRILLGASSSWYVNWSYANNEPFLLEGNSAWMHISGGAGGTAVFSALSSTTPVVRVSRGGQFFGTGNTLTTLRSTFGPAIENPSGRFFIQGGSPGATIVVEGSTPGVNDIELSTGTSLVLVSATGELADSGDFVQSGAALAYRE